MPLIDDFLDDNYIDPEINAYIDFLDSDDQDTTGFLTRARVNENFNKCGEMRNQFMVYPDIFVDLITPHSSHFHLFFYQRIMLRCMARGTATYEYFSRGTSKSFLADLDRYLKCMFVPRHNTTITAGTNKQAAEIAKQKVVDDLWVKFPLLANEMQKRKVAGKKIVLVDDIVTTGLTLKEAKNFLESKGAEVLYALVLANAREC